MTFGQKLKELRMKNNLTQKDLADQLHVTYQTVSKWENDTNEPDLSTLKSLAKQLNCSVEDLLSEREGEENKSSNETKEVSNAQHICERCHEVIQEGDLTSETSYSSHRVGRRTVSYPTGKHYYHKACLEQIEKEREERKAKERAIKRDRAKKKCYIWSTVGGVLALGISLGVFLGAVPSLSVVASILLSILIGYAIFADIYCIIGGSYIGDVFVSVSGWSIKFPGLIFSWDIEGFIWVIAMKILFAILGFMIGLFVLMLAITISAALAVVSFPFVLIHNIRTGYVDALSY